MDSRKPLTAGEIEHLRIVAARIGTDDEIGGDHITIQDALPRLLSMLTPPPDAAVREAVERAGKPETVAYLNGAAPDDIADHLLSAGYTMSEDESVAGQVRYTFTGPAGEHAFFFIEYDKDHSSDIDKLRDENKMLWPYVVAHMDAANAAMNFGEDTEEYGDDNPAEFETPEDATALIKRCLKEAASLRAVQAPRLTEHSDDLAVDDFSVAMKAKLAQKRAEGRGGWDAPDKCHVSFLVSLLHGHIQKGDPVDIANIAMMLWSRGLRGNGSVPSPRLTGEQVTRLREAADTLEAHGEVLEAQWLRAAFPELAGEVGRG